MYRLFLRLLEDGKLLGAYCANKQTKYVCHLFLKRLYKNNVLTRDQYKHAVEIDNQTHPNANGFDVKILDLSIIAEVKSIYNIKPAKIQEILHDVNNLKLGKNTEPNIDTKQFYKFMVVRDSNDIHRFISSRKKLMSELIELDTKFSINDLDKEHIYIIYI